MIACSGTHRGRIRKNNEDAIYADQENHLFIVADGMGGHLAGEEASRMAIQSISGLLKKVRSNYTTIIRKAICTANNLIYSKAESDPKFKGMGTTLTLTLARDRELYVGHVGDSRLYRLREGKLELLTEDHSKVWELYKEGIISREEARNHPYKNVITRAVGIKPDTITDVQKLEMQADDLYLLCSDGLTDMLSDNAIKDIITNTRFSQEQKLNHLISSANQKGGKDNISVILWTIEATDFAAQTASAMKKTKLRVLYHKQVHFTIRSPVRH